MKDTITIEMTQDFLDWWQKTVFIKDDGFMYIAWSGWNACRAKYNTALELTTDY